MTDVLIIDDDSALDRTAKLEILLRRLRKYGVNLEAGKNNVDGRSVRIYIDNWVADVFDVLLEEREAGK